MRAATTDRHSRGQATSKAAPGSTNGTERRAKKPLVRDRDGFYCANAREIPEDAILDAACEILDDRLPKGEIISDPRATQRFLRLRLSHYEHETFAVLFLDNRHRLIDFVELFRGTINGAPVYPREVAKEALKRNAAAVIVAHNHPSGIAEPSPTDLTLTGRLKDALELVQIRLLDHVIVGDNELVSFAERGWL